MFTTILVDDETKIDMFVKLKKFQTKTDGVFSLIVFSEVDVMNKNITGRYIIIKLSE